MYPSIHWSPQNPLFDNENSILYVLPMSKIHFVCPNPTTIMKKVKANKSRGKLYQNLWIVSRDSYERCDTDYTPGSRLLLRCIYPLRLKYYTLVFQRYSALSSQVFIPGKEYYFIATSDGSQASVDSRSGGNCQNKNMKLRIFVCKDTQDPRCNRKLTTTATEARTTAPTTQSSASSTATNSTVLHVTNSTTTTQAPTEKTAWSATSSTSESTSTAVTWTTRAVTWTTQLRASLSSVVPVRSMQRSPLNAVSDLNWTIVIPLMACLLLSLMVNIILFCRLKKRKHEYSLEEKPGQQITEGVVVKSSEKQQIEPGVDRTWLLCRRSADVTEV